MRQRALRLSLVLGLVPALACATTPTISTTVAGPPSMTALRVGTVSQRSDFEKREDARSNPEPEPATDEERTAAEDKAARRRKGAFWAGVGLFSFGTLGTIGFGIGGRVVQAQIASGYDKEDLTRADEDRLETTGEVMNALMATSAVIGLAGIALAATAYGVDHARCGNLPPRREECPPKRKKRTER